jgi:hypothetical protein
MRVVSQQGRRFRGRTIWADYCLASRGGARQCFRNILIPASVRIKYIPSTPQRAERSLRRDIGYK